MSIHHDESKKFQKRYEDLKDKKEKSQTNGKKDEDPASSKKAKLKDVLFQKINGKSEKKEE